MSALVAVTSSVDRATYARRIAESWGAIADNIFAIGRTLVEAKEALAHGEFTAMVEADLPFGPRTARRLMAIARHPVLSDRTHASVLPGSWMTLYELTKVPEPELERAIADGTVRPDMERRDVAALRTDAAALREPEPWHSLIALEEFKRTVGATIERLADRWPEDQRALLPQTLRDMAREYGERYGDLPKGLQC